MAPLIDCHVHLQDPAFAGDLTAVIDRAAAAGVECFICNGTRPADWPKVAQLAKSDARIFPCFGLHPWYVADAPADWPGQLESLLGSMASAVGECGLDRWIEPRDEAAQERAFRRQLAMARNQHVPVSIHCLRAWGWLWSILDSEPWLPEGMLIHAYGGPAELVGPLTRMQAYFSFAGNVLEPRRAKARAALCQVPLDRLLIETDAPDMPPPGGPHAPRNTDGSTRNEPANLSFILDGIAQIRGEPADVIAAAVWRNARRLFHLADRPARP